MVQDRPSRTLAVPRVAGCRHGTSRPTPPVPRMLRNGTNTSRGGGRGPGRRSPPPWCRGRRTPAWSPSRRTAGAAGGRSGGPRARPPRRRRAPARRRADGRRRDEGDGRQPVAPSAGRSPAARDLRDPRRAAYAGARARGARRRPRRSRPDSRRRRQPDGLRPSAGARLEPLRRWRVGRRVHRDHLDHRPAAQDGGIASNSSAGRTARRCRSGPASCGRRRPRSRRPGRPGPPAGAGPTGRRRAASGADLAGPGEHRGDRRDRAGHVRLVRERHELGALADDSSSRVAGRAARRRRPRATARSPRCRGASSCHGTRFAWCSASVTTISSPGPSRKPARPGRSRRCERVGDEVERLRGVLGPDDLDGGRRPDEGRDGPARPRTPRWPPRPACAPRCTAALRCRRSPARRRAPDGLLRGGRESR